VARHYRYTQKPVASISHEIEIGSDNLRGEDGDRDGPGDGKMKRRQIAEEQAETGAAAPLGSSQPNDVLYEAFVTFEACGPFGPWVISNST